MKKLIGLLAICFLFSLSQRWHNMVAAAGMTSVAAV